MTNDPRLQRALNAHQAGNLEEAARLYSDLLRVQPANFDALYLLGYVHLQRREFVQAERLMGAAQKVNPRALDAIYNRGRALKELERYEEALVCFQQLTSINPAVPEGWAAQGKLLLDLGRHVEAVHSLNAAVAQNPAMSDVWNNRGNALTALGGLEEALQSYDKSLALEFRVETLNNRGNALFALNRFEESAQDFARLLEIDPHFPYARGSLVFCQMRTCNWESLEQQRDRLSEELRSGDRVIQPGILLALSKSPEDQLRCGRIWTAHEVPPAQNPLWRGERYGHDKIRVAYLSADYHEHATSYLAAGLFETHDKSRFETVAISFGPDDARGMRERLMRAFDRFIDVRDKSDHAVAMAIRDMEIDVAVDLKGFTQGARPAILASRPAPVQVNYLGHPGTMGAPYIDYLIADRWIVPKGHECHYSEKIVYLPDSYQANDRTRRIADRTPTRAEEGLPERGFVFCSFNGSFKITPEFFDIWMRLLKAANGSVLWLLDDNPTAVQNLKREAEARDIAAQRLVFAPRRPLEEHLARHRLADLFLDTLPCNAHTTASDALWAGLPLVTCTGNTFAGRVAASLLSAVGLPELITDSLASYEALAMQLAREPGSLSALKAKLASQREVAPLFDTKRFTRSLETAFTTMWERTQRGQSPESFAVQ